MNFKNVQYYSGLFFAGLMILLSSNIQVADAAELTALNQSPLFLKKNLLKLPQFLVVWAENYRPGRQAWIC